LVAYCNMPYNSRDGQMTLMVIFCDRHVTICDQSWCDRSPQSDTGDKLIGYCDVTWPWRDILWRDRRPGSSLYNSKTTIQRRESLTWITHGVDLIRNWKLGKLTVMWPSRFWRRRICIVYITSPSKQNKIRMVTWPPAYLTFSSLDLRPRYNLRLIWNDLKESWHKMN